jgi:hypothetical protein
MRRTVAFTEHLMAAFPEREVEQRPFVDRAARYSRDCGCQMGAAFLVVSLIVAIAWVAFAPAASYGALLTQVFMALLFVFVASIAGKLLGIAIARIRLALLCRYLAKRFAGGGR